MGKITKESRGSILAPCSRHLFARASAPEYLRQQAGVSSQARAYPLDLPFDSPGTTSTMHLTDNCQSLFQYEHPRLGGFRPPGKVTPSREQRIRWFTPPYPLRRIARQGAGHCPPRHHSDTTEPLTPLSPARVLLRVSSSKEISRRTKIGFLRVPVTEPRLPRSGVPFIDRCPSRAALTATTLPSRPELHCPFALAVSLRARPPFTPPRPMVRETLLWARHCLPTSATQHDARAQPRRSRSRQIKRNSSLLLVTQQPASSAGKNLQIPFHCWGAPKDPSISGRQTSRAYPARILRPSCCVGIRTLVKVQGSEGSTRKSFALLDVPRAPSVARARQLQGWNSLPPACTRQEPCPSPSREGEVSPNDPGCLPPSEEFRCRST
jgi:hypothetical protein